MAVGAFFGCLFLIGFIIHDDFGVSWDEPDYYHHGELMLDFFSDGSREFETFSNLRYYGPVVPVVQAVVAAMVGPSPEDEIPLAHFVNYMIFLAGVAAFYKLLVLQTGRWRWALFGALMLVLSPRIFSHAFVNPKDSPFLAIFIVNVYVLVLFLERRRLYLLAVMGVASAVLIDVRVVGVVFVAMVMFALAADAGTTKSGRRVADFMWPAGIYLAVVVPLTIALWPWLWSDPLGRFVETLRFMSRFEGGPGGVAYMGVNVSTKALPWHYVPVWVAITTPLPYLFLAATGILDKLRRNPIVLYRRRSLDRHYFLYALWLLLVPVAVVVRRSTLYDEWRQLNFVYPALLIFAVAGAIRIFDRLRRLPVPTAAAAFAGVLGVVVSFVALSMIRLHPYQAVYFNRLVGGTEGAAHRFELDYWGVSYKEGLSELLSRFPRGYLDVYACTQPGMFNAVLVEESHRLRFVDRPEQADFAICAPREIHLGLGDEPELLAEYPTIYSISRDGGAFLYLKDLREVSDPDRAPVAPRRIGAPHGCKV